MNAIKSCAAATLTAIAISLTIGESLPLCAHPAANLSSAESAANTSAASAAKSAATISGAMDTDSFFARGVKQLEMFQPDLAISYFSRALLAAKSPSNAFKSTVFLMIGRAFQADENEGAAVQALTIAHALNPNDQTTTAYLADGLVRFGKRNQAAPYFQWLKAQKVKTRAALEVLAFDATKTSDTDSARNYLETALKEPGADKDGHLHLIYARLLSKIGYSDNSRVHFAKAADYVTSPYLKRQRLSELMVSRTNKSSV